jgi:hypothetical protein
MTSNSMNAQDQLKIRVDRELRFVLDNIILKIQKLAKQFKIENINEKSPFRNVLSVATEPSTSLESLKTFIRCQMGRKGSSQVWKEKRDGKIFAVALVEDIDSLTNNVDDIINRIKELLKSENELYQVLNNDSQVKQISRELHLKLTQLYLGYLAREHTAKIGEKELNKK